VDTIVPKLPCAQYKTQEFLRLLTNIAEKRNKSYHCQESTYEIISKLLSTEYKHKDDDIDYLMDVVNSSLAYKKCQRKNTFPVSKYLDWACQKELYIHDETVS